MPRAISSLRELIGHMSIYTQKHQNQLKIVTISIHQNNRFRSDPKNFLASRVLVEQNLHPAMQ